jgi:hypothetical protein
VAEPRTFTGRVSDDGLCRILSSADVAVDPDPKKGWSDRSTMNKIMGVHVLRAADRRLRVRRAPRLGRAGQACERVQAVLAWERSAPVLLAAYDRLWLTPGGGRVTTSSSARPMGPLRAGHRPEGQRPAQGHHQAGGGAL